MARATGDALGALHERLAKHMLAALQASEEALVLLQQYPELPEPVKKYLDDRGADNPALFTSITKFLKDNNITAVIEDNSDLSELATRLKSKRKIAVGNIIPLEDYGGGT